MASNSKNIGDDSIGGNSQEDDDSDDGAHLGSPRPKRLRHDDVEHHSKEQQTHTSKADKEFRAIQFTPEVTPLAHPFQQNLEIP